MSRYTAFRAVKCQVGDCSPFTQHAWIMAHSMPELCECLCDLDLWPPDLRMYQFTPHNFYYQSINQSNQIKFIYSAICRKRIRGEQYNSELCKRWYWYCCSRDVPLSVHHTLVLYQNEQNYSPLRESLKTRPNVFPHHWAINSINGGTKFYFLA